MNVSGQAAVVTGGASGLGEAVVRALVAAGARVGILDLPSSRGATLVEELGASAVFLATNVSDVDEVEAALDEVAGMGDLRVAVNCAGIHPPARATDLAPAEARRWFHRLVDVNLYGTFNVAHQAARRMQGLPPMGEERGVIINTASIAAYDGQVGQVAYAASKAGVVGMTLPLARELAASQIRLVTIAPGLFLTPLVRSLTEADLRAWASLVPHPQRWGAPHEFAALVLHAVQNVMLNGETIRIDGSARMPAVTPRSARSAGDGRTDQRSGRTARDSRST